MRSRPSPTSSRSGRWSAAARVRALLTAGHELARALSAAPTRDGGFSALTLAWVLRSLPSVPLAAWQPDLPAFRDRLVQDLVALGSP